MECCTFIAKRTSEYKVHKDKDKEEQDVWFKRFAKCYGNLVNHQLNDHRSYVQQNIKKLYFDLWKKGQDTPTAVQLLRVALRRDLLDVPAVKAVKAVEAVEAVDAEEGEEGEEGTDAVPAVEAVEASAAVKKISNKENRKIFRWCWDEVLPKVGGQTYWSSNQRHYDLISCSTPLGETEFKNIPSSSEAFVILIVENCLKRWRYLYKCGEDGTPPDKKNAENKAKYSDSCAGQNRFGGWSPAGRQRFIALKARIGNARKRSHVEEVEKVCLDALRVAHGIAEKDAKRKKKKVTDPVKLAVAKKLAESAVGFGSDDDATVLDEDDDDLDLKEPEEEDVEADEEADEEDKVEDVVETGKGGDEEEDGEEPPAKRPRKS